MCANLKVVRCTYRTSHERGETMYERLYDLWYPIYGGDAASAFAHGALFLWGLLPF